MPANGQRDACGRVYPHAKWGQDCGERQGREKTAAGTAKPKEERHAPSSPPSQPSSSPPPSSPKQPKGPWAGHGGLQPGTREHMLHRWNERKAQGWSPEQFLSLYNGEYKQAYSIADLGGPEMGRLQEDYNARQRFLEEERQKQDQFNQADYDREMALLREQTEKERQFLEADYQRQRQYIEQNAALSEKERKLALQELETRYKFGQQQLALRMEQINSEIAEEKRQAPLRLRDIADQFASQGAFYSGRRGEAQAEAQHASNLAIQGLERQLKGEKLTDEEQDALFAIHQGQFGLEAQRIALEMQTQLAELTANRERGLWELDFNFRGQSGRMTSDLERAKWIEDYEYRTGAYELKQAYEENKRRLEQTVYAELSSRGGAAEGKHLSKSELSTMLRQGLIKKNDYYKALQAQGYSADQAKALYLSEMAKGPLGGSGGKQISQSQLETMYRQGLMSEKSYVQNLKGLGYSGAQAKALAASAKAKGPTGKMISKEDITSAVSLGVMSSDTGYKNLRALGYDDYSARAILANAQARKQKSDASAARSSARSSQGRSLSKEDWTNLYINGGINQKQLIKGLQSIDYSEAEAKAIAYNAQARKSKSPSSSASSEERMMKASGARTSVNGVEISVAKGLALDRWSGSSEWIRKNQTTYNDIHNDMRAYFSVNGGTGTLSGFVSWFRAQLRAQGVSSTAANATIEKYANGISVVWYQNFAVHGYGWSR